MISGAVVCPAAPLLIPGLADALAAEQAELCQAVGDAVGDLAARSDRLLVIAPGPSDDWQGLAPRDLGPSPFGRVPGVGNWAPGLWVAAALAPGSELLVQQVAVPSAAESQDPDHRADTDRADPDRADTDRADTDRTDANRTDADRADTDRADTDRADSDRTGTNRAAAPETATLLLAEGPATGVLALADGSRCHGADAPGRRDDRSAEFERSLHAALAQGPQPTAVWAHEHRTLGGDLGSTTPEVLGVLARLLTPLDGDSGVIRRFRSHYFGAPYGVGYHLADWSS